MQLPNSQWLATSSTRWCHRSLWHAYFHCSRRFSGYIRRYQPNTRCSAITPHPVLAFAGSAYTPGSSSDLVIDGQTPTKAGTIDVDGTQLSFEQAGTDVVIGPSTQQLSTPGVTAIAEPVFTFDGSVHTTGPSFDFFIDGHT